MISKKKRIEIYGTLEHPLQKGCAAFHYRSLRNSVHRDEEHSLCSEASVRFS